MRVRSRDVVAEYPFDAALLARSRLYRASRALYRAGGGTFRPSLVSAGRTLGSAILLENTIEYTPLASELEWAVDDGKRGPEELKRFASSLFHEQNHRVLWKRVLPPAPCGPRHRAARRRYLNLAESLVITTDMALGDELGPRLARKYQSFGVIYDPGTGVRRAARGRRAYRNYLQACLHATYLNLELLPPAVVAQAVTAIASPHLDASLVRRAIARSANLNRGFITRTNLAWQQAHDRQVEKKLAKIGRPGASGLVLDEDPLNNVEHYKLGELWFELIGL